MAGIRRAKAASVLLLVAVIACSNHLALGQDQECGPNAHIHEDLCACDEGYVEVEGQGCVEETESHSHDHPEEADCGPHGLLHEDHCHCEEGYMEVKGEGCVEGEGHGEDGHDDDHSEDHDDGKDGDHDDDHDNGNAGDDGDHDDDHSDEYDCGPYGYFHGGHCDCQTGYVDVKGKGCVEGDHDHGDHQHDEGRPDWPDCECIVPSYDSLCTADAGRIAGNVLDRLGMLNCSTAGTCEANPECQAAFFIMNALHDGCPNGALDTEHEVLYHRYAETCANCHAISDDDGSHDDDHDGEQEEAELPPCPYVECNDTLTADAAWEVLLLNCSTTCGEDCREPWHTAVSYHALCPNSLTFEQGEMYHLLGTSCGESCQVLLERETNCSSVVNLKYTEVVDLAEELLTELSASEP